MPTPDPARLLLETYPLVRRISTRVSDLDGHGHLNAIRVGHLYEDARAALYLELGRDVVRPRNVVVQLTIRYLGEGSWPGDAEIGTGIAKIGTSSFEMAQGLFQKGRCIGLCDTVIVNAKDGKSAPLPGGYRAHIAAQMIRPQA